MKIQNLNHLILLNTPGSLYHASSGRYRSRVGESIDALVCMALALHAQADEAQTPDLEEPSEAEFNRLCIEFMNRFMERPGIIRWDRVIAFREETTLHNFLLCPEVALSLSRGEVAA